MVVYVIYYNTVLSLPRLRAHERLFSCGFYFFYLYRSSEDCSASNSNNMKVQGQYWDIPLFSFLFLFSFLEEC